MSGDRTVILEAKLDANLKESVAISYIVHNLRAVKIYVFNVLFQTDAHGNRSLDPELAYVVPTGNHSITVGKFLSPIPAGMKVESAEIPYLDPVEAGQALAGKIMVRLPLHPFQPYRGLAETELNIHTSKLTVQIGFLDASRGAPKEALIEPALGAGAGHFQCDYGLGLKYQEMLTQELAVPQVTR